VAHAAQLLDICQSPNITLNPRSTSFACPMRRTNTHSVNTDQRRIALNGTITTGFQAYTYTLQALPRNSGIALPGPWLLFAVNAAGVPSVAANVMVDIC
jgi:galactose oxidase